MFYDNVCNKVNTETRREDDPYGPFWRRLELKYSKIISNANTSL